MTDIKSDGNDVIVVHNGKVVFRKQKTKQTISIALDIYMYHEYSGKDERSI